MSLNSAEQLPSSTKAGFAHPGFLLRSGAIHYWRVHPDCWRNRLEKLKLLGLNTVETYVLWNAHEPRPGEFDFEGRFDLFRFLDLAAELNLNAIVRPGPYICAEVEFGGLPWWLLADEDMRVRCSHPAYLKAVDRWWERLIPDLLPYLASRGGPVSAMQIENEYGYYGNDRGYLEHLRDKLLSLGVDVPLFTSDGPYQSLLLANGGLDGYLRTANFGSQPEKYLRVLHDYHPAGPWTVMEFWVGWFQHWGEPAIERRAPESVASDLAEIIRAGAGFNFYMFHGGTNFGTSAGASLQDGLQPITTSYDYDALLDESGDITPKYQAVYEVLNPDSSSSGLPEPSEKRAFGELSVERSLGLLAAAARFSPEVSSACPQTFEKLGARDGLVLYSTRLSALYAGQTLLLRDVRDWALVLLDGKPVGSVYRNDPPRGIVLEFDGNEAELTIAVECIARPHAGHRMLDRKGLPSAVLVGENRDGERALFGWRHRVLPAVPRQLDDLDDGVLQDAPGYFGGTFEVVEPADSYLHAPGFGKGLAWINGFPLGRYWNAGPQRALYVPAPVLRPGRNNWLVLETTPMTGTLRLEANR